MSDNPEEMYAYAEIMAFVPELQRFSIECDILGRIPIVSDKIAPRYFELLFVETRTPSMSFELQLFVD